MHHARLGRTTHRSAWLDHRPTGDWLGSAKTVKVPVEGSDANCPAGAAGVFIPCVDSGAASDRGAAGVLGPCDQRCDLESRGGHSAFIWALRGRHFLCHLWIRDGLFLRRSVRTAGGSDQVLRPAAGAHRASLLGGYSGPGLVRCSIRFYKGSPRLIVFCSTHSVGGASSLCRLDIDLRNVLVRRICDCTVCEAAVRSRGRRQRVSIAFSVLLGPAPSTDNPWGPRSAVRPQDRFGPLRRSPNVTLLFQFL